MQAACRRKARKPPCEACPIRGRGCFRGVSLLGFDMFLVTCGKIQNSQVMNDKKKNRPMADEELRKFCIEKACEVYPHLTRSFGNDLIPEHPIKMAERMYWYIKNGTPLGNVPKE